MISAVEFPAWYQTANIQSQDQYTDPLLEPDKSLQEGWADAPIHLSLHTGLTGP